MRFFLTSHFEKKVNFLLDKKHRNTYTYMYKRTQFNSNSSKASTLETSPKIQIDYPSITISTFLHSLEGTFFSPCIHNQIKPCGAPFLNAEATDESKKGRKEGRKGTRLFLIPRRADWGRGGLSYTR